MRRTKAFTLIELLTVIAVIAILAAILMPSLSGVRKRAEVTTSFSNLRQIYSASQMYGNEHRGKVPYGLYRADGATNTWLQLIAPYLGGEKSRAEGGDKGAAYIASEVLLCPRWPDSPNYRSNETWKTGYGMNYFLMRPDKRDDRNIKEPGSNGARSYQSDMFFSRIPFPSTTILFGNSSDFHLGSASVAELDRWEGESHILFADGRVESVAPERFIRLWNNPSDR